MMNLPGEFVRRAAANVVTVTSTVTNTVSTVANAASGRKNRVDSNSHYSDGLIGAAKEKYNLTLKCTPNKDAITTSSLAVRSGFLLKRNEQGNWQKRYLCIVPHMFLYYFDSDTAESPRGVIDLELYTNVQREEGALKLATAEEGPLRAFFFDDSDPEYLNEWITSFVRDRYHAVCDERNAYQHMQFEMTGAIDQASTLRKMSEREREELERQLATANQQFLDTRAVLQNMLLIMGITEDEMAKLTDVGKMGQRLKISIAKMKESYERRLEEAAEQQVELQQHHQRVYEEMEKRIEQEQQARKNIEVLLSKDRKEYQHQLHELETHLETIQLNFQMAVAGKTSLEAKNSTLTEQKRVLVKEVKHLRKKLEESLAMNEDVKAMNEKLSQAAHALHQQLQEAKEKMEQQEEALELAHVALAKATAGKAAEEGDGVRSGESSPSRPRLESRDSDVTREQVQELLQFNTHLMASLAAREKEGSPGESPVSPPDKPGGEEADRQAWDMPQASLRDLAWLSEEQAVLMHQRLASCDVTGAGAGHGGGGRAQPVGDGDGPAPCPATTTTTAAAAMASTGGPWTGPRRSSMSLFLDATKAMASSSSLLGGSTTANTANTASTHGGASGAVPTPTPTPTPPKRGSMFSSLLGTSSVASSFASNTSHTSPPSDEPEDRMPSSLRMHCLRCQGTVEGPKYSTCRCSIPALLPEDLHTSSGGGAGMRLLSGFLSKGSNVAGELAGGFAKAAAQGMGSFRSTTSAAMSSHGEGTHIVAAGPAVGVGGTVSEGSIASTAVSLPPPPLPTRDEAAAVGEETGLSEEATHEETAHEPAPAPAPAAAAPLRDEDDEDTV